MKTKSLSIFLVALFVVGMNLGAEENNNKNKEGENFEYKKIGDEHANKVDFSLKMMLIGNSKVGKTALITKICNNNFLENYISTVGLEFFTLNFNILSDNDKPVLICQIWDCCGNELYRSLVTNFYRNTQVFLLAYDVTNMESFNNIKKWFNEVNLHITKDHIYHFVLIGTKIDLENARVVSKEKGENFAKEKGMEFVEVSAKTGVGIKDLEKILAKIIYEEFKKNEEIKKKEENEKSDNEYQEVEKNNEENCCECICAFIKNCF